MTADCPRRTGARTRCIAGSDHEAVAVGALQNVANRIVDERPGIVQLVGLGRHAVQPVVHPTGRAADRVGQAGQPQLATRLYVVVIRPGDSGHRVCAATPLECRVRTNTEGTEGTEVRRPW